MQDPGGNRLKVALLTREYPPEVYGGAGVHVEYLARELAPLVDVDRALPGQAALDGRRAQPVEPAVRGERRPADDLDATCRWPPRSTAPSVAHSHTWYANLAGHLAALLHGIPHVVTAHSLEPLRPWKAEQLGGGYALSSWAEKTVDRGRRRDRRGLARACARTCCSAYPALDPDKVHVIYNGIDTEQYAPDPGTDVLERYGVDPSRPSVVFVGRITRQKGVAAPAARRRATLDPDVQLVLLRGRAGHPGAGRGGRRAGRRAAQDRAPGCSGSPGC